MKITLPARIAVLRYRNTQEFSLFHCIERKRTEMSVMGKGWNGAELERFHIHSA